MGLSCLLLKCYYLSFLFDFYWLFVFQEVSLNEKPIHYLLVELVKKYAYIFLEWNRPSSLWWICNYLSFSSCADLQTFVCSRKSKDNLMKNLQKWTIPMLTFFFFISLEHKTYHPHNCILWANFSHCWSHTMAPLLSLTTSPLIFSSRGNWFSFKSLLSVCQHHWFFFKKKKRICQYFRC